MQWRIDETHSNVFAVWQKLGSPPKPNKTQYAQLEAASKLAQVGEVERVAVEKSAAAVSVTLPRHGVALLEFAL